MPWIYQKIELLFWFQNTGIDTIDNHWISVFKTVFIGLLLNNEFRKEHVKLRKSKYRTIEAKIWSSKCYNKQSKSDVFLYVFKCLFLFSINFVKSKKGWLI